VLSLYIVRVCRWMVREGKKLRRRSVPGDTSMEALEETKPAAQFWHLSVPFEAS
jgi:hypothetical protein